MLTRVVVTFALLTLSASALTAELLVLNKSDASLIFVDLASGNTLATIATGDGPHEIELSSDGSLAFVTNYGTKTVGNSLSVIDVAARKERERVDLEHLTRPHGLSFAQGHAYFSAEGAQRIGRYDPAANKVDWTFETGQQGTHMILATRDARMLFTTNMGSNNVSIISQQGGQWQQRLVATGEGPEGLDLSPNGRELWVAHSKDGGISIIDVDAGKAIHSFDAGTRRSNRLKFTPDGKFVLVSDLTAGELVVIDSSKRAVIKRVPVGRIPTGILVAPDGTHAFVACSGDNHIAVFDLKSMQVVRTLKTGGSPDGMALTGK